MLQVAQGRMDTQVGPQEYGTQDCLIDQSWLLPYGEGNQLQLHWTEGICLSIEKNHLHCYQWSVICGI